MSITNKLKELQSRLAALHEHKIIELQESTISAFFVDEENGKFVVKDQDDNVVAEHDTEDEAVQDAMERSDEATEEE